MVRLLKQYFTSPVRLTSAVVAVCAGLAAPSQAAEPDGDRVVVVTGHQNTYQRATRALIDALRNADIDLVVIEIPRAGGQGDLDQVAEQLANAHPSLIAAAGGPATLRALRRLPEVPVVSFMIPNLLDASFAAPDSPYRTRIAALAADVSPDDRLERTRRWHPKCRTLGVLHSPRTRRTVEAIVAAAARRGITAVPIEANKQQFPKAIEALNESGCDAVLMIPDAKVYNGANVKRLLLWGLRQKRPVWAFSASVVKAGALGGQYVEAESVGREAAALVRQLLDGADPASIGLKYPRKYANAVNDRTAEMIGLSFPGGALNDETKHLGGQQ